MKSSGSYALSRPGRHITQCKCKTNGVKTPAAFHGSLDTNLFQRCSLKAGSGLSLRPTSVVTLELQQSTWSAPPPAYPGAVQSGLCQAERRAHAPLVSNLTRAQRCRRRPVGVQLPFTTPQAGVSQQATCHPAAPWHRCLPALWVSAEGCGPMPCTSAALYPCLRHISCSFLFLSSEDVK